MLTEAVQSLLDRQGVATHQKVWVAVSGGADSMALLLAAHAVHGKLGVIHVDHGLREGSHSDRLFVESEIGRVWFPLKRAGPVTIPALTSGPVPVGSRASAAAVTVRLVACKWAAKTLAFLK